ncbi:hypothetical protein [Labilibaculum euxinus]
MKKNFTIGLVLAIVMLLSSCSSYNSIMRKAVKKSLGKDFKDYYAFSYPTNNFGLITSYENKLANENQYCAMVGCLDGIDIPNNKAWLHLDGLASVGTGAPIRLTESKKTKISVDAVLPKLWNALQIDASVQNERKVETTLNIGPGHVRFINKKKFEEYIESLPSTNKYKQKYESGDLILIVSDVVVEYLSVKIKVDNALAAKIDAEIEAGGIGEKLGKADLNAKLETSTSGTYELTIDRPVIVLRLAKKQSRKKGFRESDNFDDWINVIDYIEN